MGASASGKVNVNKQQYTGILGPIRSGIRHVWETVNGRSTMVSSDVAVNLPVIVVGGRDDGRLIMVHLTPADARVAGERLIAMATEAAERNARM